MKLSALSKTVEFIAAFFILVFAYTATSKLMAYDAFVASLETSPVIGFASKTIGWAVPAVELLISLILLMPAYRIAGLMAAFSLMVVFTTYIAYMLMSSSHLPCSCGGVINQFSWQGHLWFNVVLTFLAAVGIILHKRLKLLLQ